MGERALEYNALVPQPPNCGTLPFLPHHDPGLAISTTIPGVRAKRNTPQCVLQQETTAVIEQPLSGRLLIFTDDSVAADVTVAAACVVPALSLHGQCRLPFTASSTTAELAAIDLVADLIAELLPPTAVVLCDSRALSYCAQCACLTSRLTCGHGTAAEDRHPAGVLLPFFSVCALAAAATTELQFRWNSSGSPACAEWLADETIEHVLLQCPGYADQRRRLFDTYGRLGLPHVSLDHLRFARAHLITLLRAFEALLNFFYDGDLFTHL
ncbi:hypothetical protein MRX96_034887 [Rhipicephalus microplus]